jgi:hypothetical protein
MSTIDPVVDGGVQFTGAPTFTPVPIPTFTVGVEVFGTGLPRIRYNGKNIDLPAYPVRWQATPEPAGLVNVGPIGQIDTILYPRMEFRVTGMFEVIASATLRTQLTNFQQWALKGNPWSVALNSSRVVDTTLIVAASVTATLELNDATGVIIGEIYKLMDSSNFELVTIAGISGNTVTLAEAVLTTYAIGTKLRDQNYFPATQRTSESSLVVEDLDAFDYQTLPQSRFRFSLDFHEDVVTFFEHLLVVEPPVEPPAAGSEPTFISGVFTWFF